MTLSQAKKRWTPQEYYELERDATFKSDYYNGEIYPIGETLAMAGGTARHSLICSNLGGELRILLKGKPCAAYESNLRLKVKATGLVTYPDVSVYCGPLEKDGDDRIAETYVNPTAVFEVLSRSTEAYDRGFKSHHFRRIDSLKAYVLVSQESPHVEIFERQEQSAWLLREARGRDSILQIPAISVTLSLAEVYDRVSWE